MVYAFTLNDYKKMGIPQKQLVGEMEVLEPRLGRVLRGAQMEFFHRFGAIQDEMYEWVKSRTRDFNMMKIAMKAQVIVRERKRREADAKAAAMAEIRAELGEDECFNCSLLQRDLEIARERIAELEGELEHLREAHECAKMALEE